MHVPSNSVPSTIACISTRSCSRIDHWVWGLKVYRWQRKNCCAAFQNLEKDGDGGGGSSKDWSSKGWLPITELEVDSGRCGWFRTNILTPPRLLFGLNKNAEVGKAEEVRFSRCRRSPSLPDTATWFKCRQFVVNEPALRILSRLNRSNNMNKHWKIQNNKKIVKKWHTKLKRKQLINPDTNDSRKCEININNCL